ncbi:hypothetical protein D5047_11330 [Verminephrobacter eiseniae]|nr:hypothetical protein [Verminephrobacter eiseniae]
MAMPIFSVRPSNLAGVDLDERPGAAFTFRIGAQRADRARDGHMPGAAGGNFGDCGLQPQSGVLCMA